MYGESDSSNRFYKITLGSKYFCYSFGIPLLIIGLIILPESVIISIERSVPQLLILSILFGVIPLFTGILFMLVPIKTKVEIDSEKITSFNVLRKQTVFLKDIREVSLQERPMVYLADRVIDILDKNGSSIKLRLNLYSHSTCTEILNLLKQKSEKTF